MAAPAAFWPGGVLSAAELDAAPVVGLVAVGAAYLVGVRRLAARGRAWPRSRSLPFGLGLVALGLATQSGVAALSTTWYSAHVVEHLLVGMVGPLLLAAGAPLTLLSQAGSRRTQQTLIELLDLPVVRAVRRPLVALGVFLATLVALNLPVLVEASRNSGVVHGLVHLHALAAGLAFASVVTGADPAAWRVPPPVRLGVAVVTVPAHAFVAMAVLSLGAGAGLADVAVLGAERAVADQRLGAALLWVAGDLVGLAVATLAGWAWATAELREGARWDRRSGGQGASMAAPGTSNSPRPHVESRNPSSVPRSTRSAAGHVDSTSIRREARAGRPGWVVSGNGAGQLVDASPGGPVASIRRRFAGTVPSNRWRRPVGRRAGLACLAATLFAALLATGCSDGPRYGVPESAATQGDDFLDLWRVFAPLAIFVVLFIWALVLIVLVRSRGWRRRPGEPSQHQYDGRIELIGVAVPIVLVAGLFAFTVVRTDDITALHPDPDLEVEVLGFQWSWRFTYLDDGGGEGVAVNGLPGEVPVLRLPLGRTVRFDLVAADVIHSFWVPEFLTKRDLVPGIDNEIDITTTRPGRWTSRCAEYCGLNHTDMRFVVEVMPAEDFDAWLAGARRGGSATGQGGSATGQGGGTGR